MAHGWRGLKPNPNPATRNRTRDHLIPARIYSQMLYQLSYSRRDNSRAEPQPLRLSAQTVAPNASKSLRCRCREQRRPAPNHPSRRCSPCACDPLLGHCTKGTSARCLWACHDHGGGVLGDRTYIATPERKEPPILPVRRRSPPLEEKHDARLAVCMSGFAREAVYVETACRRP